MKVDVIAAALEPFAALFEAFSKAGFQLYAVGGCVRDWMMNRPPKDIDFTTDALPEQTKQILSDNGWKVIPVGEVFGTIATIIQRKQYEITTFRVRESYTRGSRHPIVCYGKELSRDLERRDLTINAMAADAEGNVIDPFDGLGDIERRILRVPRSSYEQTISIFGDDPLRILRLARFKARLGFDAASDATSAASDMAGSILTVSHERWFSEIDGLLRAQNFEQGIEWLYETGIWQLILPEFCVLKSVCREPSSLSNASMVQDEMAKTLFEQTIALVSHSPVDGDFRWASLFAYIGYASSVQSGWANQTTLMVAAEVLQRLKLSVSRTEHILKMLKLLPEGEPQYRIAREFAIELGNSISDWDKFQDIRLNCLKGKYREYERERLELWRKEMAPYLRDPACAEVQLPRNLSASLSQELGVRGKTLGLCIAQCRDAVLDKYLSESDDCCKFVDWVRAHFG